MIVMAVGVAILGIGLSLALNLGGAAEKEAMNYERKGFSYRLRQFCGEPDSDIFRTATGWRFMGGGYCVIGGSMWLFAILIARSDL